MHLKIISLFDGLSGTFLAVKQLIEEAGYNFPEVKITYFASEIDRHAERISEENLSRYPNVETIRLGDVRAVDFTEKRFAGANLLVAGFPCQAFSIAGKKEGREDAKGRGDLVDECIRARKEAKPRYYLFENVASMSVRHERQLSQIVGHRPIEIDSARLTAQRRTRLYWTNIRATCYTLFGLQDAPIPPPPDRGLVMQDILESGKVITAEKSNTLLASKKDSPADFRRFFLKKKGNFVADSEGRCRHYIELRAGRRVPEKIQHTGNIHKDSSKGRGFPPAGKSQALTTDCRKHIAVNQYYCRHITVREAARLQGIPDDFSFAPVSKNQAFKAIGNGFTIPVISYILSFSSLLKNAKK